MVDVVDKMASSDGKLNDESRLDSQARGPQSIVSLGCGFGPNSDFVEA